MIAISIGLALAARHLPPCSGFCYADKEARQVIIDSEHIGIYDFSAGIQYNQVGKRSSNKTFVKIALHAAQTCRKDRSLFQSIDKERRER
jgi:hypothetical protein